MCGTPIILMRQLLLFQSISSYTPFQQPERVFFNPFNSNGMWVTGLAMVLEIRVALPVTGNIEFGNNKWDETDLLS